MGHLFQKHLSKVVGMRPCDFSRKMCALLLVFSFLATVSHSFAIDNPDAQDYTGQFLARERQYVDKINDPTNSSKSYLIAYEQYQLFLDQELNAGYKLLMAKLSETQAESLQRSQKMWTRYRDAEFGFIDGNWTQDNFGSSAGLSRGAYRCEIIKTRVLQMLYYLKNY